MLKTIKDVAVAQKRILVRCDFNVPLDDKGEIIEDFKIRQALSTIQDLLQRKAKVILMSHLDPENTGVVAKQFNLNNVGKRLSDLLGSTIMKADDCIGLELEAESKAMKAGSVLLLENLRFYKEETECDLEFAKKLSYLGDVYVNDAFGVDHRNHASVAGVPQFLPHVAGLLLEKETESLDACIQNPARPMVAILGGKKVEEKAAFINAICAHADVVIISGLLKKEAEEKNIQFLAPEKIIAPKENWDALDIDQATMELFSQKIMQAKTVLWNGPFGHFEDGEHGAGTLAIAKAIIASKAFSVVGGGQTVEFLNKQGIMSQFSHVSTGGGAMLDYLSGDAMPGIEALKQ